MQDMIVVIDFGSQYSQLIARRVRELNVYSELCRHDVSMETLRGMNLKGIILSGGGSLLKDLDILLSEETRLPVTITDDPLSDVVLGSGAALENLSILKEVAID